MQPSPNFGNGSRGRYWLSYLVLAFCLTATALGAYYEKATADLRADARFRDESLQIQNQITTTVNSYIGVLHGASGLASSFTGLTRPEFKRFVSVINIRENYPGVQGVGFSMRVPPELESEVVKKLRSEGHKSFQIWPPNPGDEQHSILYLEPEDKRNLHAIGFNMFSESVRRQAMEAAWLSGSAAVSGKVKLKQEITGQIQPGFLVYVPVYKRGFDVTTSQGRRDGLLGFVYSPFRAHDFFATLFRSSIESPIHFRVYDGLEFTPEALLYEHGNSAFPAPDKRSHYRKSDISFGGHSWSLEFAGTQTYTKGSTASRHWWILIIGAVVSFILYWLTRVQMKSQVILENQTRELAQSADALRAANTRTNTILESITDGFFSFDVTGKIIYVNERGARLAGRNRQELLGQVLWDVYPDLLGEGAGEQLQRAIYDNVPVQFETFSQLLDRWFDMRAYPAGDGLSVYFADISDRKAQEEAQRKVYETEHEISMTLQQAILTTATVSIDGITFEAYYRPAQDQHLVGGDFHDVFEPSEGYVGFVIGDVAGKGINAAVRTAMAKNALRALAYEDPSPASVLNRLNSIICKDRQDGFITLFYGLLDLSENELLFANAGHEPPLWMIPDPYRIVEIERPGVILGCLPEAEYQQHRITMDHNHRLLLYTDGFTEARDGDDFFGPDRLKQVFLDNCNHDDRNCIQDIVNAVMSYSGGVLRDDTAAILLTIDGKTI